MKTLLPWLAFIGAIVFVLSGIWSPPQKADFDLDAFGRLPILTNGRIKPLDTVARTTLLVFQNRQRVGWPLVPEATAMEKFENGGDRWLHRRGNPEMHPLEWLLDLAFRPDLADTYPTFTIDNTELLALVGKTDENLKIPYTTTAKKVLSVFDFIPSHYRRFTYQEIFPFFTELERQAQLAQSVDAQQRTPFQRAALNLYNNLVAYQQIKYSFVAPDSPDFLTELHQLQAALPAGLEAVRAKRADQPHDEAAAQAMVEVVNRFDTMTRFGSLFAIPPAEGAAAAEWHKAGQALLDTFKTGEIDPTVQTYATLAQAWQTDKPEQFNTAVSRYHDRLLGSLGGQLNKTDAEVRFNEVEPFYQSMLVYACAFLVGIASWLRWPQTLGRTAFFLVLAAYLTSTAGILTRMWLEGRPPVTNLYSSALFVGWGSVGLCLILEIIYKNAIGSVAAGAVGFCALLIAHHLSFGGDTLEMMRAVLDNNFWLGTHVVVVTMGYASTFLAGFLALIYIFMGVFTTWLPKQFDRRSLANAEEKKNPGAKPIPIRTAAESAGTPSGESNGQALSRMVYGIVCFATLFSLVGTILGGIWADQSWGRFWGWDPKENGALIIVIWNALILHARAGGMVKARGLMCLAVFGNVVTSWSWFGTNMLGIGLHSYGFMEAAFYWLIAFVISQVAIILLAALLPLENWRSFRGRAKPPIGRTAVAKS